MTTQQDVDNRRMVTQQSIDEGKLNFDFSDIKREIDKITSEYKPHPVIYLGIDPGATGAIAGIDENEVAIVLDDCPPTIHDIASLMKTIAKGYKPKAIIEKVNAFYKSSAKSAFTFGGNFSAWQMALSCYSIPYEFITPRQWQKAMFDSAKQLDDTKKQSYERASRLFPNLELKTKRGKILDGRCDALLLAEYLRRQNAS